MPRLVKGSQDAKDFMAMIRAKGKDKPRKPRVKKEKVMKEKDPRRVKGSKEAKEYMAMIRGKRK
jgi:hypothetical protein